MPNPPEPSVPQQGVQNTRYGDGITTAWRLHRAGITSDESVPSNLLAAVPTVRWPRVLWVLDLPAGVTGCTLVVGRVVKYMKGDGSLGTLFVEDNAYAIDQAKRLVVQETNGDPVWAYVTNIVGTVGAGISIVRKAAGPGTPVPE